MLVLLGGEFRNLNNLNAESKLIAAEMGYTAWVIRVSRQARPGQVYYSAEVQGRWHESHKAAAADVRLPGCAVGSGLYE